MNFISIIFRLLCINLIFLFVMSLFRCAFFFYFGQSIDFTNLGKDIVRAFFMGIRLDASILATLNVLVTICVIVLMFVKSERLINKIFSFIKNYYYVVIGTLFVLLCCDFGFFSYFQEHFSIMIFGLIEDDTKAILLTMWHNYNIPLLFICFIFIFFIISVLVKKILKFKKSSFLINTNIFLKILMSMVFIAINFLIIRGSLGDHPLIVNSTVSTNTFLNKIATNGIFTLQNAIEFKIKEKREIDYIKALGYQDDIRKAFSIYTGKDINDISLQNPEDSLIVFYPKNEIIEQIKPNVIIIAMESFGTDLLKYNSETFDMLGSLKQHFDKDIVFYNFVPAWNSTQQSVEGIITNIAISPSGESRFNSKYRYINYSQTGHKPYKQKGYKTYFVYGGNLSWRNIGRGMDNFGFDKVIGSVGLDENYFYNEWGVYDEFLFDYVYKILENGKNSKFIYAVTTTNHPPYSLPSNYKNINFVCPKELKDKLFGQELAFKRFQTYRYANDKLGKFISKIKQSKFADNTIIAVTGDHNFKNIYTYKTEEFFDSIKVPFYLYIPKKLKQFYKVDTSVFGSYIDILPTVYSLSLSDYKVYVMGKNLLSSNYRNNIVYSPGNSLVGDKNYIINYDFMNLKNSHFFKFNKNNKLVMDVYSKKYDYLINYANACVAVSEYMTKKKNKSIIVNAIK